MVVQYISCHIAHTTDHLHKKFKSSVIASKKVDKQSVSRWGIFKIKKISKRDFVINDVIEKPNINSAPSNYAVIGRYILPKKIFHHLILLKKLMLSVQRLMKV